MYARICNVLYNARDLLEIISSLCLRKINAATKIHLLTAFIQLLYAFHTDF